MKKWHERILIKLIISSDSIFKEKELIKTIIFNVDAPIRQFIFQ